MNGVINLYKKKGITSFGAVAAVRKATGIRKVGHTGTLDPEAEGVLPVCVGKATKLVDYIMAGVKTYRAGFSLGKISDTLDIFGNVEETGMPIPDRDQVEGALKSFSGDIMQRPPMYSALKVDGKRLYDLAREGVEVERKMRPVTVYEISLTDYKDGDGELLLTCSKGTYVRSVIDDLGRMLGCGGVMTALTREKTGVFTLEDAVTLEELEQDGVAGHLISMEAVLSDYEAYVIPGSYEKLLLNGMRVMDPRLTGKVFPGRYRAYTENGNFVGILEREEDHLFLKVNLM